ncbi:MAG: BMP family ABC transporter substrate-binding protein [Anaerolineae bacterium]|nr:BMP family ABC transporter substrate-binding protein [Anaerolineae bacterium]
MIKRLILLVLALTMSLIISACNNAASEPAPTAVPPTAAEPTEQPQAEAPTAEPGESETVATEEPSSAASAAKVAPDQEAETEEAETTIAAIDEIAAASLIPDADIISPAAASAPIPELSYGLVVSQLNDRGYNDLAWAGMKRAEEELGVSVQNLQDPDDRTVGARINQFLNQGVDGVFTTGSTMARATQKAAHDNPDIPFAIIDFPDQSPNDRGLLFDVDAPAFMAGYLAAGMSQSGTVCTYGGQQIPPVLIFMVGFEQGVDYYNDQNDAEVKVLGWHTDPTIPVGGAGVFAGNFNNQAFGQTIAGEFASRDCDIIFPVAGGVGLGTAEVAAENGLTVIGVDADQSLSNPDYADVYLTSVIKRIDQAVFETIAQMADGTFEGNSSYIGTLENGGVDLAPFNSFDDQIPQTLKDDLADIRQELIDGTLLTGWPIGVSRIQMRQNAGNLNLNALRNATYSVDYTADGTASLTNGEYHEPAAPGSAAETEVRLGDQLVYGDLNGDGKDEAITFLVSDPGGSGTFFNLVVIGDVGGKPTQLGSVFLGDRIIIKSLEVEDGLIAVGLVTQGPGDAQSSPTQAVVKIFGLQDDALVELASQIVE